MPIPETNNEILLALLKKCLAKERKGRPNFKEIVDYLKDVDKHRKCKYFKIIFGFNSFSNCNERT